MLSIIIPAYNEAATIEEAMSQIHACMCEHGIAYEAWFINDGSKDATAQVLQRVCAAYSTAYGVQFSRNFGKEAAIFCGLQQAQGDCAVVMDCDLQHPVSTIPFMLKEWEKGYEVVEGRKAKRQKEGILHRTMAKLFYGLLKKTSQVDLHSASDFKLLDRKVIDALNHLKEKQTFFRALSGWVGFKTTYVEFTVAERFAGKSQWSFMSLLHFALNNLASFSSIPMQAVTFCGVVFFLFSIVLGIDTLYSFFSGQSASGFTTVILLLLIMGSVIMFSLGVIGFYLAKIYDEIKERPRYIVSEILYPKEPQDDKTNTVETI